MLSHDQLAFAITKLHPDLVHGKDFWVAHPVAPGSDKQMGEAQIIVWPEHLSKPDREALLETFRAHADAFHAPPAEDNAQRARAERTARLAASDWTQMPDIPPALRKAWEPYRQALRNLPEQTGFPDQIVWPQPPADSKPRTD